MEDKSTPAEKRKFYGLLSRRERWGLTWRGWLVSVLTILLMGALGMRTIHPFLAVHAPVEADHLVMEGWVHDYAVQGCVEEFKRGSYEKIYSTGGPVSGLGGYVNDFQTSASVGADRLRKNGVATDRVVMVPTRVIDRDRTYSSAVALREWFATNAMTVTALNVVTEEAHARRSRLLYQMAFGEDVDVGVIGISNPDYDADHWWRYSEGVKDVLSEGAAYLYARLLFSPR